MQGSMKGAGLSRTTADRPGSRYAEHRGETVAAQKPRKLPHMPEPIGTGTFDSGPYEIAIRREHLTDEYIDDKLRARGLDTRQIREAKSKVRAYLDLLLKDRDIDMTDDAYCMLVNMAIHLIEESSRVE